MNIDFTCQKCEGSFELDSQDLIEGTEKLECPHCEARATSAQTEDLTAALTELQAQIAALGKRFTVSVTVETDDLEEDEDEDEEDDDEDESDEDEDEDDEDEDDDEDEEEPEEDDDR
ncbi:MAG: hypothetical protein K1X89_17080 [Myxococcaceae bacterium]|nr:hypothetical protein [Myxococcaceae bacterium]